MTKIKEKLEYYLSESNNIIKINEKLKKGIKKMENEDTNIIKLLSYVSKINKTKNNINKILYIERMRNLKFEFEEEKNNIKYEEYFFNGIPIPKNIIFKGNNIAWNIDKINYDNIENEKINFNVEIRKENEEFIKIYEGNNNSCIINDLIENINYEIRICSLYNNINGQWSQIQTIKTKLDSIILNESKREDEFVKKFYEWIECKNIELIFRGTRDGMTNDSFLGSCCHQGPTIILIKSDKEYIFGGYASISWESHYMDSYCSAPESFLFTLINAHNTQPTKFISNNDKKEIRHHNYSYGPVFGGGSDLGLCQDFLNGGGWSSFPYTYQDSLGKGKSIFTGDNNNGGFKVKEIEVFKVFK